MKSCQNDVHTRILNVHHRFRFLEKKCAIVNMAYVKRVHLHVFYGDASRNEIYTGCTRRRRPGMVLQSKAIL